MDLYRQQILDHYKNPRNFGELKSKAASSHAENPSCGDSVAMDIEISDGHIKDIRFQGEGCAIAVATTSLLTEFVKGKKITDIADLDFNDMQKLLGVTVHPARRKCAMLGLNVLKKIILKELQR
jgi:nitrogen fixation NifU-like protein